MIHIIWLILFNVISIHQNVSCFVRWMGYLCHRKIIDTKLTLLKSKVLANLEDRLQQGHLALRHWQRLEPWVGIVNFNNQFR